ncbi:hypothetical protein RRG08_031692 [Elysia crispata]|uniref:C1q domain-containing protein n=1 Tax=Elysia crispata TaxID=231223 RepID=A0AAE1ABA2_9GAST|nr:hypothetical protein RRG08_031692 [Elysia crispata]
MVMIKQTTSNGDAELLNVLKTSSELEKTGGNRTQAEANLKSPDGGDSSTFLTVKILEPVESDSGTYECQILYLDNDKDIQNVVSSATVNVTAVPPPNFVPQTSDSCECEDIMSEIDAIKASLASGGPGAAPTSTECQVSFSAQFQSRNGYLIEDDATAVFDSTTSNKGGAYDTSTGEFTAPCAGQYFFTVVMRSHQDMDAGYVDAVLKVDDSEMARTSVFTDSAISNMQQATTGSIVTLTEGQKVKVVIQTTSSGELIGTEYSVFSGFYVSP